MNIVNVSASRSTVFLLLFLAAFFVAAFTPIWDSDFWWHIASGRWIAEHHALPQTDPFGVYSNSDTVRYNTVLKGQWLGQLLLYWTYATGDAHGVIALRAAIVTLCLALLYWRARRLSASRVATWAVVIPAAFIALGFTSDRPQLFSYLFATLSFLTVEHYERTGRRRWLATLPIIAIVWGNTHGGYLLGIAALWLYVAALWFDAKTRRRPLDRQYQRLAAATLAFTVAAFMNPNGLTTLIYLMSNEGTSLEQATSEYRSAFRLYEFWYIVPQLWVILIYALALTACAALFRNERPRFVLVLFLGAIGAWSYRYFAFLVFIAGPYVALGLGKQALVARYAARWERFGPHLLATSAAAMLLIGANNGLALASTVSRAAFPVAMLESLRDRGAAGKTFNHMQWGGYLLWYSYPGMRIYIDGRMLDRERFPPYTQILWATPLGLEIFDRERFDTVMIPLNNRFTNERYPLNDYLLHHRDWQVAAAADGGTVYVRRPAR